MELLSDWFFPNGIRTNEAILLIIGFVGQGLFSARFLIQWVVSEKKRESVIPLPFWYFSLLGGITLFIYAFSKKDLVLEKIPSAPTPEICILFTGNGN